MTRTALGLGLLAAASLLVGAASIAGEHEIRFHRPFRAGDQMGLAATAEEASSTRVSMAGKVVQEEASKAEVRLEADVKVLAVDGAGHPTRLAYTIRKFSGSLDGEAVEPIPAGQVVVARAGEPFALQDGELSEEAGRLLAFVIAVKKPEDPADDAVFGTRERKKVGDTWPVSKAEVVKGMATNGMTAEPANVSGSVRLVEEHKVNGVPCLKLAGSVEVKAFAPPLPPEAKVESAKMGVATTGEFPVDTSVPRLAETAAWTMSLRAQMPTPEPGQNALLEVSGSRRVSRAFTIAGVGEADAGKPFRLGAGHRLPWGLVASEGAVFEDDGIRVEGQSIFTRDARFFENDFALDLVFWLAPDRNILCIDFGGGGGKYPLRLRIHPPRFAPSGIDLSKNPIEYDGLSKNTGAGDYRVRIERTGDVLTYLIDAQYDGAFKPDVVRSIPDVRGFAPFLDATNAHLRFGNAGLFKQFQLTTAPRRAAPPEAAAPERPYRLVARQPLAPYLDPASTPAFGEEGVSLSGRFLDTRDGQFFERDFVLDLLFSLGAEDGILVVGFGSRARGGRALTLRIHSPRFGGSGVDLSAPDGSHMGLARNTGAGEYMLRIDRRGDALTFALDAQYDGEFKPEVERTIPDIKQHAPYLNAETARLFFGNAGTFKAIRLGKAPPVEFDPADPIYAKLQRAKANHTKAAPGRLADAMLANAYRIAIRDYALAEKHDLADALEAEMEKRGFAPPTPTARPGTEDITQREAVAKEVASRLGGRSRFPSWLEAYGPILAGKTGLRTRGRHYIRTKDGGFLGRDFVFEVVYSLGTTKEGDGLAFVGLGEGGNRSPYGEPSGSVNLRIHPADLSGGQVALTASGPWGGKGVGNVVKPGTHKAIIAKDGNAVTFTIDVGNDGPSPDDITKTIAHIGSFARFLNDTNTHLFFGGGGEYQAVRIIVKKPAPPEAAAEGAFVRLGGRLGLAPYLVAQGPVFATKAGVQTHGNHYIRTKDGGFLGRDFVFELIYSLRTSKEGEGIAFVGLGEGGNRSAYREPSGSVNLRIHPPDIGGGEVMLSKAGPTNYCCVGKVGKAGTHKLIITKRGNAVTFAIDAGNDGPSPDDISKTLTDIKAFAPFLNEKNTHLFFGGGGTYEQVRVTVSKLTRPPADLPAGKLYRLAPGEPVPPYLDLTGAPLADKEGIALKDRVLATKDASFFEKDFVIDLVFAIAPDDGIMCIEFGDKGSNKHLLLRLHPPKFAPQGVDLSKDAVRYHGVCLNTGACDHMLRIERKGNTITYSLDAPYDGTFQPQAFKRVDDITTYVPYLTAQTAILRLRHGGILKQIQIRDSGGTLPKLPEAKPEPKDEPKQPPRKPPKKRKRRR